MKNSKKIFLSVVYCLFFLVVAPTLVSGQQQKGWTKTEEDKKELKKFKHNYFHSIGFSPFINFFTYNYKYYNDDFNTEHSASTFNYCLISFQYDARYNVLNYHDFFSLSVSTSPMMAFSMSDYTTGMYYQLPLGLDLNFFLHSTYNNISDVGFSLSGGVDFIRATEPARSLEGGAGWTEYYGKFILKYRKYKLKSNLNIATGKKNKNYYSYLGVQLGRSNADLTVNGVLEEHTNKTFKIIFGKIIGY